MKYLYMFCAVVMLNGCTPVSKPSDETVKTVAALCEKHGKQVEVYYTSSVAHVECKGIR